ncbi:glycosyltransferase [Chloroflexi bacterium TSY]|nr:glycosyltransferase [Chloroflexi bacterium TSY]
MNQKPLVSCIMPTYNRRSFIPQAIDQFLRQDYPHKELIVLDDGTDSVADLMPDDVRIRYRRLEQTLSIGAKRNLCCKMAGGEIVVHWDDDDWMADWRLSYQVEQLLATKADICGTNRLLFFEPQTEQAWEYVYPASERLWVAGGTLCYTKAFWQINPFPDKHTGEDTQFVWANPQANIKVLDDHHFYIAQIHSQNTCHKQVTEKRWRPYPGQVVKELLTGWRRD